MENVRAKHVPLRMCVACRKMRQPSELVRFVSAGGTAVMDLNKKQFGRGAYICRSSECLAKAAKKNVLARHLKCSVPKEIYAEAGKAVLDGD